MHNFVNCAIRNQVLENDDNTMEFEKVKQEYSVHEVVTLHTFSNQTHLLAIDKY